MASTSGVNTTLSRGGRVPASEMTTAILENFLSADSDISDHGSSGDENNYSNYSDSEPDVPVQQQVPGVQRRGDIWDTDNGNIDSKVPFSDISCGVQPHTGLTSDSSPTDILLHFLDKTFIEIIVTESNAFYKRVKDDLEKSGKLTAHSRLHQWVDISGDDIYQFLALIIIMSVIRKPTLEMYWTADDMFSTPFFGKCMSSKKFFLILRFLHFTSTDNPQDKLNKLRPIYDYLNTKFGNAYRPGERVTVDESLMLWKGRLQWKQFIRTKRARFGIKSFDVCESKSGYVYKSSIYTGKGTDNTGDRDLGLSGSIVMHLMQSLLDQGRTVYLDNWYSSPKLFEELSRRGTNACGTVRANRVGLPKDFDPKNLLRGEMVVRKKAPLTYIVWNDKRVVHALSNCHGRVEMVETGKKDPKTKMALFKPDAIQEYNMNMGGVDLVDQVTIAYPSMRKTIKWYKKVFLHMLDITIYNSLVIWRYLNPTKKLSYLEMREKVARSLLEEYYVPRSPPHTGGRKSSHLTPLRLKERHFVTQIPPSAKKKFPSRRCVVCKSKGIRKEVRLMCTPCDAALCLEPCFVVYHSKKNY